MSWWQKNKSGLTNKNFKSTKLNDRKWQSQLHQGHRKA